jgi:nucleoside-diphosphate-sugar epimerase
MPARSQQMKILMIGGTGFIGPHAARQLQAHGHEVIIFHRGNRAIPADMQQITGDRNCLHQYRETLRREHFDVVIDFILSSERQARDLMQALCGITQRVVALSSMDVYRAWGVFYRLEPGGLQAMPLTEDSELRTKPPYPPEVINSRQQMISWIDAEYDKVPVERVVLGDPDLPGTVLRLPMIYGPGDYVHRFYPFLKRMDDRRPFILFAEDVAAVRTPRGYVEDVAAGIALAATSERTAGRVCNICERESFSELEWARKIAATIHWDGEFIVMPREKTPAHLVWPYNTAQHLVVSSERIREELGYREQLSREEAFVRTIAWERTHLPQAVAVPFNYEAEDEAVHKLKSTA